MATDSDWEVISEPSTEVAQSSGGEEWEVIGGHAESSTPAFELTPPIRLSGEQQAIVDRDTPFALSNSWMADPRPEPGVGTMVKEGINDFFDTARAGVVGAANLPTTIANKLKGQVPGMAGYTEPRFVQGEPIVDIGKAIIKPSVAEGLSRLVGADKVADFLGGTREKIAETVSGLATPENAFTAPFLWAKPIQAMFAGQVAANLPEQVGQSYDVLTDPNSTMQEKGGAVAAPVISTAMLGALGKGLASKPAAPKAVTAIKSEAPVKAPKIEPSKAEAPAQTHAEVAAELGLKPVADVGGMWQFNVTDAAGKEIPFAVKAGAPKADITARAEMLKKEMGGEAMHPDIARVSKQTPDEFTAEMEKMKQSGRGLTKSAYDLGERLTESDLPALEVAEKAAITENRRLLSESVKNPDKAQAAQQLNQAMADGMKKQYFTEALKWRRALDEAKSAKTIEEFAAIEEKHGVGDGINKGQGLKAAFNRIQNEKAQTTQGQEVLDEGAETVALDPATGSPLSATDSLINKLEVSKPFTGKPLTRERQRTKNIQERADAKQAEVQRNIEADKSPVETPVKEFDLDEAPAPALEPVGMGAAAAGEVTPSPKTATSIKNAQVDVERQRRGLPPAVQPAKRSFGKVWDDAMAAIDRDPGVPDRLINELRDKPRSLTDAEDATLLHRQIDLQNEYGKATRDLAQAFDDGRMDAVPVEQARVQALSDQLLDLYNIGKKVGTETGRGLNARKMMAMEDFSLAKMELEKRAANKGRPLTPKERTELVDANKRIEETQKKFDEYVTKTDRQLAERDMRAALDEMQKDVKSSKPKFPKSEDVEAQKQKIKLRLDEGERSDVSSLVQKLARMFVEQGIRVRDPLIDAVHGVLKEIDPQFTRRETMDAISGYGDFKQLTKDEISLKVRDLKGQMQQVAKLEDMQANKPPLKTGVERRIPSTEESRLIRLVNEAKNQFQIPITDPATQLKSSLDTLKARLKNETAKWEDKLKRSDFAKKPKRVIQMDAEANKLHFENAQAKAKWHEALMKDRLARRSLPQKIFAGVGETINTARAIMTSFDLSAVLRQGGFIALGHPFRAAKSFPAMFKAFGSEAAQHAVNREITNRKSYPLMAQSKLYLSEHGQKLSQMEEAYMSRWADKIPLVAGSQRAYTTFLNKLRADSFDAMANSLSAKGELTPVEANAIANYINIATGRGNLGMRDNALVGLNTVFFAPRYVASRFQLALGQPMYRGSARTRVVVAKEYARYLAGLGVVYALGQSAGADVETDPRSADFGKMRWGNTRLDPLSGLSQTTVLMSRLASGETKTLKGEIKPIRGPDVPFGSGNSADVMARFLRTKLAPAPGAIVDVLSGKDVVGNEVTATSTAQHLMTPLAMRDIYNAMLEQGIPEGTALGLLSVFGMGLQTYEDKK